MGMIDDGVWNTDLLLHSVYKLVQDALLLILSFDPAQKRIQVSDRSRPRSKILDPSSRSQIHLWSNSQISNLKSTDSTVTTLPAQCSSQFQNTSAALSDCRDGCGSWLKEPILVEKLNFLGKILR